MVLSMEEKLSKANKIFVMLMYDCLFICILLSLVNGSGEKEDKLKNYDFNVMVDDKRMAGE